jgi:hypothetical protein
VATAPEGGRPDQGGEFVSGARHRRERLRATMDSLEAAIGAPARGREREWAARVAAALSTMEPVLQDHVVQTEAADGLLERVVADSPRLGHLRDALAAVQGQVAAVGHVPAVEEVRSAALDLLGQLARHRHRGADLLYEAYSVDVGEGD